jgi:beta-lactamase class A
MRGLTLTPEKKKRNAVSSELTKLRSDIVKLSKEVNGQMGFYMKHIESGKTISIDADKIFPLGSVFKLGVVVETFRQADASMLSLDERIELETRHYCIGEGLLQYLQPGLKPTIKDLLSLMIIAADNTASEMLWKRIGIQRVNMLIREMGLAKTSIYIPYRESFLMSMGYGPYKDLTIPEAARRWKSLSDMERMKALNQTEREAAGLTIEEFRKKYESMYGMKAQKRMKTQRIYDEVFDNVGSPGEIGVFLEKLVKHEVVSPESSETILSLLMRQENAASMSCLLSPEIPVALKSGDTACSVANAGVIYVSTTSHVVLCCFFKNIQDGQKDKAIQAEAKIARHVYEHFSSVRSQ